MIKIFNRPIVENTKTKLQRDIARHATAIKDIEAQVATLSAQLREHTEVHTALSDALMSIELAEGV